MKIDDLRKMWSRARFRPFQIHLTSGEILPVEHPENMSLPEDETEMFVVWTQQDWNLVEAGQVARVSVKRHTRSRLLCWILPCSERLPTHILLHVSSAE